MTSPAAWIKQKKELCDGATEGPWYREGEEIRHDYDPYSTEELGFDETVNVAYVGRIHDLPFDEKTADMITASRTDWPKTLKALEVAVEALTDVYDKASDNCGHSYHPHHEDISKKALEKIQQILEQE